MSFVSPMMQVQCKCGNGTTGESDGCGPSKTFESVSSPLLLILLVQLYLNLVSSIKVINMSALNEIHLRSLPYGELKQLAQEYQVYKTGKKSKEAIIKRLLKSKDSFGASESVDEEERNSRNEDNENSVSRRETFFVDNSSLPECDRRETYSAKDSKLCGNQVSPIANTRHQKGKRVDKADESKALESVGEELLPKGNRRGRKVARVTSSERLENEILPFEVEGIPKTQTIKGHVDIPPLTRQGTFTLHDKPAAKTPGAEAKKSSMALNDKAKTGKGKRVDFAQMTPSTPKERKMTIHKTPIPNKTSLSVKKMSVGVTPVSMKKTPSVKRLSRDQPTGQFSARKMPDFAEIHRRQFHKMESLVQYKERKASRALNLLSPSVKANATFSEGTGPNKKMNLKEAKRSFIPIRKNGRDTGKENHGSTKLSLKPSNTMESMKARQRELVRGVRTNKRFLLQMKARGLE